MKEPNKICIKCNKRINHDDNYIRLEEFRNTKSVLINFWHKHCFDEVNQPKKMARILFEKTNRLLDNMGGGQKEESYIVQ